jgi:hypothetical protein
MHDRRNRSDAKSKRSARRYSRRLTTTGPSRTARKGARWRPPCMLRRNRQNAASDHSGYRESPETVPNRFRGARPRNRQNLPITGTDLPSTVSTRGYTRRCAPSDPSAAVVRRTLDSARNSEALEPGPGSGTRVALIRARTADVTGVPRPTSTKETRTFYIRYDDETDYPFRHARADEPRRVCRVSQALDHPGEQAPAEVPRSGRIRELRERTRATFGRIAPIARAALPQRGVRSEQRSGPRYHTPDSPRTALRPSARCSRRHSRT